MSRAVAAGRFRGEIGQILTVLAPRGVGARSILVAGLGKPAKFNDLAAERVAGALAAKVLASGESDLAIAIEAPKGAAIDAAKLAAHLAVAVCLRAYRFDKYRTPKSLTASRVLRALPCIRPIRRRRAPPMRRWPARRTPCCWPAT